MRVPFHHQAESPRTLQFSTAAHPFPGTCSPALPVDGAPADEIESARNGILNGIKVALVLQAGAGMALYSIWRFFR